MKAAFYTLGCKVNSYETEAVIEQFEKAGYEIVDYESYADVYVVNSCMVTNTGERKSKKYIRRPLQSNPDAITIVMGCLSQLKASEMLEIEGVKIVLGTKNRDKILEYIDTYRETGEILNRVEMLENHEAYDNLVINDFKGHQRAFLKIQDGCNNFCTYCIIPYTRGRIRSKEKNLVLQEAKRLVDSGHIEIVLTGIHTGGYGQDLENYSFANLLSDLEAIEGLKRIRISSIEMTELDDQVVDVISRSHKIVNHLHIPLQSGSDRILKLMNRKYTTEEFVKKIEELKMKMPNLAITTDIIVGFPSESEADFNEQMTVIDRVNFQELHVFPFSKREGTLASKMKEQIPNEIKKERVHRLLKKSESLKETHIKSQLGKVHHVIMEQIKDGYAQGHTRDYILVRLEPKPQLIGKETEIKITHYDGVYCYGELV